MTSISRRDAGKILLAGCAGALVPAGKVCGSTKVNSVFRGVRIGVQSCSFRHGNPPIIMPLDDAIDAIRKLGIGECELWDGHVAPQGLKGADLTKWRVETPASHFKEIRKKFDDAGVLLNSYSCSFHKDFADEEIEHFFLIAQALGVNCITGTRSSVSDAPRVDKYAQKYKIKVGFHGHDNTVPPDEFSSADTYARAMEGASPYIGVSLDIGHFTAGGWDPVAYISEHHSKVFVIHLKDRKKSLGPGDQGQGGRFGQGDSNVAGVLRLLRDNGWKIPADIEDEYLRFDTKLDDVTEAKANFEYCKKVLES